MRLLYSVWLACSCMLLSAPTMAQVPVQASANHATLLASSDAQLAANKRLVYDFWREVLEAGHVERAPIYLTESYIQHNPLVPTGRDGFVQFFAKVVQPAAIQDKVQAPLVSIVAEGDMVVLSFVRQVADKKDPKVQYTTTWFDMFRLENGKIAEHWDNAVKP